MQIAPPTIASRQEPGLSLQVRATVSPGAGRRGARTARPSAGKMGIRPVQAFDDHTACDRLGQRAGPGPVTAEGGLATVCGGVAGPLVNLMDELSWRPRSNAGIVWANPQARADQLTDPSGAPAGRQGVKGDGAVQDRHEVERFSARLMEPQHGLRQAQHELWTAPGPRRSKHEATLGARPSVVTVQTNLAFPTQSRICVSSPAPGPRLRRTLPPAQVARILRAVISDTAPSCFRDSQSSLVSNLAFLNVGSVRSGSSINVQAKVASVKLV